MKMSIITIIQLLFGYLICIKAYATFFENTGNCDLVSLVVTVIRDIVCDLNNVSKLLGFKGWRMATASFTESSINLVNTTVFHITNSLTVFEKKMILYKEIIFCSNIVKEFVGLHDSLETEYPILIILIILCLPYLWKRSSGNYQEIMLQFISGLSILLTYGCFVRLIYGMQEGHTMFGGKVNSSAMGALAVGLMVIDATMNGAKKEIYGYGVCDLPADDRCALVFDYMKTSIFFGKVTFFNWAAFGFPSRALNLSLLSVFPIIGNLLVMDTYFTPAVDKEAVNNTEEDLSSGNVTGNNVKNKSKHYFISEIVRKMRYAVGSMFLYICGFPWSYVINVVIHLVSIGTLTYCLWYLSEDLNIFTIMLIDKALPHLILKAKERQLLTDNNSHRLSEILSLTTSCVYYRLFREQIILKRADSMQSSHPPLKTLMYKEEEYPKIFCGSAALSTVTAAMTLAVQQLLRGND